MLPPKKISAEDPTMEDASLKDELKGEDEEGEEGDDGGQDEADGDEVDDGPREETEVSVGGEKLTELEVLGLETEGVLPALLDDLLHLAP